MKKQIKYKHAIIVKSYRLLLLQLFTTLCFLPSEIVNTLKGEGEIKLALGKHTDTRVDRTSIAISMLVTFLVTAAIMSFLAISLGFLLFRYYRKGSRMLT